MNIKKFSLVALTVVGLTTVAPLAAQAKEVLSRRPIPGYICYRRSNQNMYRCRDTEIGDRGVNVRLPGGTRVSF